MKRKALYFLAITGIVAVGISAALARTSGRERGTCVETAGNQASAQIEEAEVAITEPVTLKTEAQVSVTQDGLPPQWAKDTVATACSEAADKHAAKYEKYNISREQFKTECYLVILAQTYRESRFDTKAVGDGGLSHGALQQQTKLHGITVEQAQDYAFATRWAIDHLVKNGFPRYYTNAITRYNGAGPGARAYASAVKETVEKYRMTGI